MKTASHRLIDDAVQTAADPSYPAVIDLSALNGTDGFRIDGVNAVDQTGYAIGSGDFNGDGYADIIIGGLGADPSGHQDAGSSYVVFGHAGGFSAAVSLAGLDGKTGFQIDGIKAGDYSGYSVASAGDINHDGYDDLIVGAYAAKGYAGDAYVMFGKPGGWSPDFHLANLNGTNGFHFTGTGGFSELGQSVAAAGDVNGDGFDDLIVSADGAQTAYVVFGKASGYAAAFDLTTLNGANGFQIVGLAGESNSAQTVADAGDVNGDGIDDLIIGAGGASPGGKQYAGSAYVLFGKAGGFGATVDVSALNGSDGFRLDGFKAGDRAGQSVAAIGDFNGDGYADFVVGAELADAGGQLDAGSAYVVFGKAGGFAPAVSLAGLHGASGFRIDGSILNNYAGYSVASAGDFNGDGFDDIIVSALNNNSAYIVFGKASGFTNLNLSTIDGTNGIQLTLPGGGYAVSAAGDVNGDGLADVAVGSIVGEPGAPVFAGSTYIVFGRLPDGPVTRIGGAADQTIWGGAFDDSLSGKAGDDILIGGAGADTLNGGGVVDTFVYKALSDSTAAAPDLIVGLTNLDRIDLSAIDANPGKAGDQAFQLVAALDHHAREVALTYDAAHDRTVLEADVNGDGVAEMTVWIAGDHHTFSDFVL